MAQFIKKETEVIMSEEITDNGYIVESQLYKMEEELNGLYDENGEIPKNSSFVNEENGIILRYYDLDKNLYKTIEANKNVGLQKIEKLYKNGVLHSDENIPTVKYYNKNGECFREIFYNQGKKIKDNIIIEDKTCLKNNFVSNNGDIIMNETFTFSFPDINKLEKVI